MSTIFTKVLSGEIPSYKIAEDDNYYSFLDIFPVEKGHVLVIPKKEVDYIFDLDSDAYTGLLIASASASAFWVWRYGMHIFISYPLANLEL